MTRPPLAVENPHPYHDLIGPLRLLRPAPANRSIGVSNLIARSDPSRPDPYEDLDRVRPRPSSNSPEWGRGRQCGRVCGATMGAMASPLRVHVDKQGRLVLPQ